MSHISIVITSFNSKEFIKPCLDSLFDQCYQDFEVIVVDNGSRDGTVDFVKKKYPGLILIENKKNLGACRARNQGIEASCGEWILTLDCDITLEKGFLSQVKKIINNLPPKIGILQPKILRPDKETIYSCGIFLSWLRRFYDIGKGEKDIGQFDESKYIFGACSACALYKRRMLQELKEDRGYFDERFFFLVEDVDLAWRAQRKDWKGMFYPEIVSYHFGNSSKTDKKLRQYLCFRNRHLSILKNERLSTIVGKIPLFLIYDLPRVISLMIKYKGNFPNLHRAN